MATSTNLSGINRWTPKTEGSAYTVLTKDFRKYPRLTSHDAQESTCHKFDAMGYGGFSGKVTGTVALACRHQLMLPASVVDMDAGEKQAFVDFAVASGLQNVLGLLLLKMYYDIACQYMIHFLLRLLRFDELVEHFSSITSAKLPEVQAAVPKYHVNAHESKCRSYWSPNFLPGCGREDGETLERQWSMTNALALRTKEMTAGHRHDTLNDHFSDLNVRKVHSMPGVLLAKLHDAQKLLTSADAALARLEENISPAALAQWKPAAELWDRQENPFAASGDEGFRGGRSTRIAPEEVQDLDFAGVEMVKAIHGMIHLERERAGLVDTIHKVDRSKTRQRSAVTKRVNDLLGDADI
ncbi:hypothetical protein C8Q73DRAFT_796288 [Cubamyces lactineus]|nr:hypothetical protein C8Q73DRAFT_796288 [Cubamyces lactineus]